MSRLVYIYPTDTVWGIGGSIFSSDVFQKIAQIKQRDKDKPVSILFSSIEQLQLFFNFPNEYSKEWLSSFFSLETTALIPKVWEKREIPAYLSKGSEWIGVRCLRNPLIVKLIDEIGDPIITTSLNQSNEPPIIMLSEARRFHQKYSKETILVEGDGGDLSGSSSSIVKFGESGQCLFLRIGKNSDEIKRHMELLST